jgi:hypothetical protein
MHDVAALKRVRVPTGFAVTGEGSRERLPAPVGENRDVQT